jgi:hypothetical protein
MEVVEKINGEQLNRVFAIPATISGQSAAHRRPARVTPGHNRR